MIYKTLTRIAVVSVPIAPVTFFGWRVGVEVFETTSQLWLAIPAGFLTATGLEIVGVLAGHIALRYYQEQRWILASIAATIMAIYVYIGASELVGTIGETVFYITPLVYILAGLQGVAETIEVQRSDATEFEREQWRVQQEYKHTEKLARIDAKNASHTPHNTNASSHTAENASASTREKSYSCDECIFVTDSPQAYSAHKRWGCG